METITELLRRSTCRFFSSCYHDLRSLWPLTRASSTDECFWKRHVTSSALVRTRSCATAERERCGRTEYAPSGTHWSIVTDFHSLTLRAWPPVTKFRLLFFAAMNGLLSVIEYDKYQCPYTLTSREGVLYTLRRGLDHIGIARNFDWRGPKNRGVI